MNPCCAAAPAGPRWPWLASWAAFCSASPWWGRLFACLPSVAFETMKTIYLSGPMTGLPEFNFPAFHAAAKALRACGYDVANPAEINATTDGTWQSYLRKDIKALCDCDALALLPGWEQSPGAHLELHVAHRLGLEIRTVKEFTELDNGVVGQAVRCSAGKRSARSGSRRARSARQAAGCFCTRAGQPDEHGRTAEMACATSPGAGGRR